ncbi:MAG: hypothetical protein U0R69_08985 [Gaiellales bacterium]
MVSKLNLRRDSVVLDPCGVDPSWPSAVERLADLYRAGAIRPRTPIEGIIAGQLFLSADIDTFATSLAAIRLFFLDEHSTGVSPQHLRPRHAPSSPGAARSCSAARRASWPTARSAIRTIDEVEFDAIVGNPPARKPYKEDVYRNLYEDKKAKAGARDGRPRHVRHVLRERHRATPRGRPPHGHDGLVADDVRPAPPLHPQPLQDRRRSCSPTSRHFAGVGFQVSPALAITTLEKCSDPEARKANDMRLVDYVREPADFSDPPPARCRPAAGGVRRVP